ncbi:MAG: glycerol-3-phosphate acyltransferase [Chloroflexi bacterium]|nr:glycerol-3-phosphate acyltransferase [Chloroflexota bacterium]
MIIDGVIAVVVAYLLGSIPFAYIVTRLRTGKDIRKLGGGNAGARNVYREVGLWAAIPVAIGDVGKGAAAVAVAYWILQAPPLFVLAAGLAAVAGHIWSVYLKFSGGNGLSASIGVLSLLMTRELLIVLGIMLVLTVLTRNPVLSLNIGILSLPVSAWVLGKSELYIIFSILLILIMVLNFLPTAKAALAKAGSKENLFNELLRRNTAK